MTAEDRREDPAEALAQKMRDADQFAILWDEGDPWPKPEGLLPYARALIEAERALTAIEDVRTPNDATAADHLRAPALAALRAVIGEP